MPRTRATTEINALHAHLHHTNEVTRHKQGVLDDTTSQLRISQHTEEMLRAKVDALNHGWKHSLRLRTEALKEYNKTVSKLKTDHEKELAKLQAKYDQLVSQKKNSTSDNATSKKAHEKEIASLTSSHNKAINELDKTHKKQLKDITTKYDKATNENKKLTTSLQAVQKESKQQKKKADDLSKQISKLEAADGPSQTESKTGKKEADSFKKQVKQLKDEIVVLKGLVKKAESELTKEENKRVKVEKDLDDLRVDRDAWRDKAENNQEYSVLNRPYSPANGALMSPAPLHQFGKDDATSESRSRFTDNLPFALDDSSDEDADDVVLTKVTQKEAPMKNVKKNIIRPNTPRRTTRSSKSADDTAADTETDADTVPNKISSALTTPTRKPRTKNRVVLDSSVVTEKRAINSRAQSLRSHGTKADVLEVNGHEDKAKTKKRQSNEITEDEGVKAVPGRATRSNANVKSVSLAKDIDSEDIPIEGARNGRRSTRRRNEVSYDYDKDGRDISNFGMDYPLRRSPRHKIVTQLNFGNEDDHDLDSLRRSPRNKAVKRKQESLNTKRPTTTKKKKLQ